MKSEILNNLAEIQYGYPFKSKYFAEEGKIRIIRIRDIKKPENPTFYDGDYEKEYIVNNGDIIVGMDGEFNCVIWESGLALLNQRIARITPMQSVSKMYLFYLLKMKLKDIEEKITKTTVKHLLNSKLRGIEIPLLSIDKQKEVSNILTKTDYLRNKREQANQMVNKILQAVFFKMFGNPVINDKEFPLKLISEVCYTSSGGTPSRRKSEYYDGKIPWVKSGEVNKHIIQNTEERITELGLQNCSAKYFDPNTVLVAMYGATAGKSALLKIKATTNQAICGIVPNLNIINHWYLLYYFRAIETLLVSQVVGGGQPNLSQLIIRKQKIPLPPLALQTKFASIVESLECIREKQEESTKRIEEIFESLMSKAFKGELVSSISDN